MYYLHKFVLNLAKSHLVESLPKSSPVDILECKASRFLKKEPNLVRFELIIPILLPPYTINTFLINIRSYFEV